MNLLEDEYIIKIIKTKINDKYLIKVVFADLSGNILFESEPEFSISEEEKNELKEQIKKIKNILIPNLENDIIQKLIMFKEEMNNIKLKIEKILN